MLAAPEALPGLNAQTFLAFLQAAVHRLDPHSAPAWRSCSCQSAGARMRGATLRASEEKAILQLKLRGKTDCALWLDRKSVV